MKESTAFRLTCGVAVLVMWGLDALIWVGFRTKTLPVGRDHNGWPDTGLFGWIGSALFCVGLAAFIGLIFGPGKDQEKKP